MNTINCKKCGCVMAAISEACPLCGTPTNQNGTDNMIECENESKAIAENINTPTAEEIEKLVRDNPALDGEVDKDELDYQALSQLYSFQSKIFPNHFIGCKEIAELLSISSFSYDDLWNYWQTLIELDWGVWPICAVLPQHEEKVKSLVDEYNSIATKGKYADSILSLRIDRGMVFLDGPENGPKKKGVFGGDYTKLRNIYETILSYCDGVILPPQYDDKN